MSMSWALCRLSLPALDDLQFVSCQWSGSKVTQAILRHSNIDLTISKYTYIFRGQESEDITKLPDLSLPANQNQKTTGTYEEPVTGA